METYAYSSKVQKKSEDKGEITNEVYIAVKKDFWEGKHTLSWVLEKFNKDKKMKIVFIHVYVPGDTTSTSMYGCSFVLISVLKLSYVS